MGGPRLVALIAMVVAVVVVGGYGVVAALGTAETPTAAASPPVPEGETTPDPATPEPEVPEDPKAEATPEGPEVTATRYLDAWEAGDGLAMLALVADPPTDFIARHERFNAELRVVSLSLTAGELRRDGEDAAELPFTGVREVAGLGRPWEFASVLRLGLRDGEWKVLWSPETMHPSLKDGGSLRLKERRVARPATLTMEGRPFPENSRAGDHFTGLDGTAVELAIEEVPSGRVLVRSPAAGPEGRRTTISFRVQQAAARALDGVAEPAAIVAVDVETRQVRAVADTLGGKQAFLGLFPPGSTFKVVTAAALLRTGLTPQSPVPCPGSYTIPGGRGFTNADPADRGTVPLATAFALSCNTTFVQQAYERLRDGGLRAEAADRFGFREKPGLSHCRIRPHESLDELGADAIGQNSVQASPLCMAEVAAAVASGVWRPAVMSAEPPADSPPAVPLGEDVAAGLRTMMAAVVAEGTAASAGLPPGTAGKTGTAEVAGQRPHAWFIGYRGSIAFAVFVRNAGAGGQVAAPLAARFLAAL